MPLPSCLRVLLNKTKSTSEDNNCNHRFLNVAFSIRSSFVLVWCGNFGYRFIMENGDDPEIGIETFVINARAAQSARELDQFYLNALGQFGFSFVMYGNFLSTEGFDGGIRINTFPDEWWAHYLKNNLQALDPTLRGLVFVTAPFEWKSVVDESKPEEDRVLQDAAKFGMTNGVICPIRTAPREFYAVSMCGREQPTDFSMLTELQALSNFFHAYRKQFETEEEQRQSQLVLTAKQTEYLEMVAEGYSIEAIALAKKISESGVKKRLGEAYKKLGVNNGHFAVAKAIAYGVISPKIVRPWLQE